MNWKIPLWTAGAGVTICAASLAYMQLDLRFNFFHNPTVDQAQLMGSYREPLAEEVIDDSIPILTPGTILLVGFQEDTIPQGEMILYLALWGIAAIINAVLYGVIGLLAGLILERFPKRGKA